MGDITAQTAQGGSDFVAEPLEFRGKTGEFFGIWIVNVFLTIITLGIYSAWAKVRTNRYFYGNIYYKNSAFEYTADPIKILKGRLLVFGIYAIFYVSLQLLLNPLIAGTIFIFALAIMPWLINRSIKFRLHNTKHRNIRFVHHANSGKYYLFYLLHGLLYVVSLGFSYGYSLSEFKKLLFDNSSYGSTGFQYNGKADGIYWQLIKTAGFTILLFVIAMIFVLIVSTVFAPLFADGTPAMDSDSQEAIKKGTIFVLLGVYLAYFVLIIVGKAAYDAFVGNYVWENISLEQTRFKSTLKATTLAWIYGTNVLAIIFSIGLFTPWARVRITRYKCKNFAISCPDISAFIATSQEDSTAIGEEAEDFFDIDIGF